MTAIEALSKELERLHEDYQMADPWRKDAILKEISKINTKLILLAKGEKDD